MCEGSIYQTLKLLTTVCSSITEHVIGGWGGGGSRPHRMHTILSLLILLLSFVVLRSCISLNLFIFLPCLLELGYIKCDFPAFSYKSLSEGGRPGFSLPEGCFRKIWGNSTFSTTTLISLVSTSVDTRSK